MTSVEPPTAPTFVHSERPSARLGSADRFEHGGSQHRTSSVLVISGTIASDRYWCLLQKAGLVRLAALVGCRSRRRTSTTDGGITWHDAVGRRREPGSGTRACRRPWPIAPRASPGCRSSADRS